MSIRDFAVGAVVGTAAFVVALGLVLSIHDRMLIRDCDQYGMTRLDGKIYQCHRKDEGGGA